MKRKVKYVKKTQSQSCRSDKPNQSLSSSAEIIGKQQEDSSIRLAFQVEKYIILWLTCELPPCSDSPVELLDLRTGKLEGPISKCKLLKNRCDAFFQRYQYKILQGFKISKSNLEKLKLNAQVFDQNKIINKIELMKARFAFPPLDCQHAKVSNQPYFYIATFQKQNGPKLDQVWDDIFQDRGRSEDDSEDDDYDKLNVSLSESEDDEENDREEGHHQRKVQTEFSNSQSSKKKYTKKEDFPRKNGQQVHFSKPMINKIFPIKVFDLALFQDWIRNHHSLKSDQFSFKQNPQNTHINLTMFQSKSLYTQERALKQFTQFQKIFLLNRFTRKNLFEEVKTKFCESQVISQYVKCTMASGYMHPKTTEEKLRVHIRKGEIGNKSNYCNQRFNAVVIHGLKNLVEQKYDQILEFIMQLPHQNLTEKILLHLGDLKSYIYHPKVKDLLTEYVREQIKSARFKGIDLIDIIFLTNDICLKISVENQCLDLYESARHQELQQCLVRNRFLIEDIVEPEHLTKQLEQQFILLECEQNSSHIVLIERPELQRDTISQIKKIICEMDEIIEKQFVCREAGFKAFQKFFHVLETTNSEYLKAIKCKVIESQGKILLTGKKVNVEKLSRYIQENMEVIHGLFCCRNLHLTQIEKQILKKHNHQIQSILLERFGFHVETVNALKTQTIVSVRGQAFPRKNTPLVLRILESAQLEQFPEEFTFIFSDKEQLDQFKENRNVKMLQINSIGISEDKAGEKMISTENLAKKHLYVLALGPQIPGLIRKLIQRSQEEHNKNKENCQCHRFWLVMPKKNVATFIASIISDVKSLLKEEKIQIILHFSSGNPDQLKEELSGLVAKLQPPPAQKQQQFYVVSNGEKLYYSKTGKERIMQALMQKLPNIHLSCKDINMDKGTHIYYSADNSITHLESQRNFKLQETKNGQHYSMTFQVDGTTFKLPEDIVTQIVGRRGLYSQFYISAGIYQIDLVNWKQINVFSKFSRSLHVEENKEREQANCIEIEFDSQYEVVQLHYESEIKQKFNQISGHLRQIISQFQIETTYELQKPINESILATISESADMFGVKVEPSRSTKSLVLVGDDQKSMNFFVSLMPNMISPLLETVYPQQWTPQQKPIEVFTVQRETSEFKHIQSQFRIHPIIQLIRIQNSIVYKRFMDEKAFLESLNGTKVRQRMLYHGTRKTEPELIYLDQEQCFNINYTSERNLLGKAIYFAEKPEYSQRYSFVQKMPNSKRIRSMFYCCVLAGESETMKGFDQEKKDTKYKDESKRLRYESSTAFLQDSQVYAVYKNKRAYPSYLIKF